MRAKRGVAISSTVQKDGYGSVTISNLSRDEIGQLKAMFQNGHPYAFFPEEGRLKFVMRPDRFTLNAYEEGEQDIQ